MLHVTDISSSVIKQQAIFNRNLLGEKGEPGPLGPPGPPGEKGTRGKRGKRVTYLDTVSLSWPMVLHKLTQDRNPLFNHLNWKNLELATRTI